MKKAKPASKKLSLTPPKPAGQMRRTQAALPEPLPPSHRARQIAGLIGLSSRAVEMQLAKLKQDGRLKRVGPKKGGHWEVRGD